MQRRLSILIFCLCVAGQLLTGSYCKPSNKSVMDEIKIKVGDSTEIRLESLSTAGYTWEVKNDDSTIVSVVPVKNQQQGGQFLPAGRSFEEVYTIKALHTGAATVLFQQKRSWEDTVLKEKKYVITVL